MEPVYSSSPSAGGYVQVGNDEDHDDHEHDEEVSVGTKTNLMPSYIKLNDLTRPDGWAKKRIDVTVITSGNFRDLYSTQAILMDNAFRVALARSYFTILNDGALKANPYYNDMKDGLEHIVASIDYYGVGKETFEENCPYVFTDCIYASIY